MEIAMTLADQIRDHVARRYIQPAHRSRSLVPATVTIVAGDIVRDMKLEHRCPEVCGAIDAQKFLEDQNIILLHRNGPKKGDTASWQFLV